MGRSTRPSSSTLRARPSVPRWAGAPPRVPAAPPRARLRQRPPAGPSCAPPAPFETAQMRTSGHESELVLSFIRIYGYMAVAAPALLDSLGALSDATRCRMLLVLERHELTVGELCDVLQLPQSTVSRHLKVLSETGWVGSRRDGTSRFYSLNTDGAGSVGALSASTGPAALGGSGHGALETVWALARDQVAGRPGAVQDQRRLKSVLARRVARSQTFFASS